MNGIKAFFRLDIVKEILWTIIIFAASLLWSLAMMLCIDFMFFQYNKITMVQFSIAAFCIACILTIRHIVITVKKYKNKDESVL